MRGFVAVFVLIMCSMTAWAQYDFRAQTVIVKVKPEYREQCNDQGLAIDQLQQVFELLRPDQVFRKFPKAPRPQPNRLAVPESQSVDISLIYELHYEANVPVPKAVMALQQTGVLEYAEPAFIAHVLATPNDALIGRQWHLEKIRAFDAWDVDQGSSDIVIGVTDTGIDWDHPDLENAIVYNDNDPIDGVDNDSNGYVDDYRGWNFYDNNNDPDETSWSHGTHVSGLACASTDNGIGVAGTGWNCKVLPVKCGSFNELTHGYEGVIYAYERGAQIINCSWGNTIYTDFGHDVMQFVSEEGVLLIAGAGNNNNDHNFYPASFPEVMSVAASDSLNNKAIFSSYNYNVDITAPGERVYSTKNGTYDPENGTSMSSPIVAGAAALVMHRFPQLTPAQIIAQLKETAQKDYYDEGQNSQYQDQLGTGLLDMRSALDSVAKTSIRMWSYEVTDNQDEIYALGEEVELGIELLNLLGPTGAVKVELSSLDTDTTVVILDGVRNFPPLGTNARTNNFAQPFTFTVNKFVEYNQEVTLQLDITSGDYATKAFVQVLVNPDFINVAVNDIASSVSSHGLIGYASDQREYGLGYQLDPVGNLLYEGGLLIGHQRSGINRVVDRIRGEQNSDQDFWPKTYISRQAPQESEAFYAFGAFTDTSAITDEIGLEISQRIRAYDDPGHRHYFIAEYTIANVSDEDLTDVYVGMYADWDIRNAAENRGTTVYGKRLGYVYSSRAGEEVSAGIQVVSTGTPFYSYMINHANNGAGGIDQGAGGFSTDEKYITLTENRFSEEGEEAGTDVSHVVSTGGFYIPQGDSITVAFAILAGASQDEIQQVADSAYTRYNGYGPGENVFAEYQHLSLSPNPTNAGAVRLDFDLRTESELRFFLYDMRGTVVANLGSDYFYPGTNFKELQLPDVPTGAYILRVHSDHFERTFWIISEQTQ